MPNNRIYDLLNKPVADPNHNAFDLGQFFPFSLKLGQVKPIYFVPTVPGGTYRLSVDEITHTEPFITDPFVRMSKHIEFVFIPYSQLWHGFSQFIGHANDPQSSYEQGHAFVPCFSLGRMLQRIWTNFNSSSVRDMQGLQIGYTALSLLDMLGYGAHPIYNMGDSERTAYMQSLVNKYCSAWNLLAYNKYWNTFLRDTQHTQPLNPAIFNADRVPCTNEQTCKMDNYYSDTEMLELVTIKYRKVKRDIFTSALTSRQFGAVESVTFNISGTIGVSGSADLNATTGTDWNRWSVGTSAIGDQKDVKTTPDPEDPTKGRLITKDANDTPVSLTHNHPITGSATLSGSASISGSTGGFNVYTLLTAQLMQKWREQIQRAGNQTEDRLRAIYGSKPASDAKNQPYIIGSTSYDITANQVTSTSNTDTAKLADIAAKGVGYAPRNEFEFSTTEFGVILAVTYVLPENSYLNPVDKTNTLIEPFDYFVNQLENLGLEQIEGFFRGTLDYQLGSNHYIPRAFDSPGFAARYWYYKQKPNVVHLGFEHGRENSKWMPSRISIDVSTGQTLNPYYIAPNEYDTVFGTTTDFNLDTDQFIGCCRVTCDAVLPMSEIGLPRW